MSSEQSKLSPRDRDRLAIELADLRWRLADSTACLRALLQHKTVAAFGATSPKESHDG